MFVVLQVAQLGMRQQESAWHLVNITYYLPFILLAPINGAIGNELPKRWVLVGSATYCLIWTAVWSIGIWHPHSPSGWGIGLSLTMVGAAIFSPARYALLPAAAHDSRMPLTRVNGLIEMGASVAGVAGLILALYLPFWLTGNETPSMASHEIPMVLYAVVMVNFVSVLSALPVRFASDVRRPESAKQAVVGFFRDCRRIWLVHDARVSLLLLACFWGLLMAGSGAVFTFTHALSEWDQQLDMFQALLFVATGTAAGAFLAGLQGHPRRALGLVPLGGLGMLLALAWAAFNTASVRGPALALGFSAGLVLVPLRASYQGAVPADARGNALAVSNTANYFMVIVLALVIYALTQTQVISGLGQIWLIAVLAAGTGLVSVWLFFRDILELLIEFIIWPFYRIQGHGPGLNDFPAQGPLVVVVNHSSWFDPVWLAKVLPRRLTPMMTSVFYDKPIMRWLMVRVIHAIRVEASEFRREAPELQEAVTALDQGECVVVFPEGRMRRRDEQLLHRFGQGIWHILRERPITPVIACWIEGGWGSYFSYRDGPPATNKRLDRWRKIDVAVSEPEIISSAILANHRATRSHLMRACLDARKHLGLETHSAAAPILEEHL
jgi:1-acyl-sn-glycerol-3-phosphate acyltransferase